MDCKKCTKCGLFLERYTPPSCPVCGGATTDFECSLPALYRPSAAAMLTPKGRQTYIDACRKRPQAMCEYAHMLRYQTEGAPAGKQEAYSWYLSAAANGYADGYYWAAHMQNNREISWTSLGGTPEEAVPLLKLGAQAGSVRCKTMLASFYLSGRGVAKDSRQAARYLGDAVAAGDAEAMVLAAQCHLRGTDGFEHSAERAKELYKRAGALLRMYNDFRLAYETGAGLPRDGKKAKEYSDLYLEELKRLARTSPQRNVPNSYACRAGDEYLRRGDPDSAAVWYRKALELGDVMGRINLQKIGRL